MKKKKLKKQSRKEDIKGEKPIKPIFNLKSKTYFLTYKGISTSGEKISKMSLANYLLTSNPNDLKVKPVKYLICEQMYDSGEPHFHCILIYDRRKEIKNQTFYDYLGIHPNIQPMRNMRAALDYVYKQDPTPYTNMNIAQERRIAKVSHTSSLYDHLYDQMIKDPFNFNPITYCNTHNLTKQIYKASYTKALHLLKLVQPEYCNSLLRNKPGFKFIDRALIETVLSPEELRVYDSWDGFQAIVDVLNQIPTYGYKRPIKTPNLLLTSRPNTGKTTLVWNTYPLPHHNPLTNYCSVYPMGMKDWFPEYKSEVYSIIFWNQARLTSYPYDTILQILDGSPVMLPAKGGGHKKADNPLVFMTSNLTLTQMVHHKFGYNSHFQLMALDNLRARVKTIVVPDHLDLFILQKLIVPVK